MTQSVEEADRRAIERWKRAGLSHPEISARLNRRIDERVIAKHKAQAQKYYQDVRGYGDF